MTDRRLTISFGGGANLAAITDVRSMTWAEFAAILTASPPETEDKASVGWYSCCEFSPVYRDSENLVARYCVTLDYDVITPADVKTIQGAFSELEYAIYTTWRHTADKPRLRVVFPLTRPATADEFCAVSRILAERAGIELASRESHVPAQMMFLPSRRPGSDFRGRVHAGNWVDVDGWLALYPDWTDRTSWPSRETGDSTHSSEERTAPEEKDGIVGLWCRTFDVLDCIAKFELPYVKVRE